MSTVAPSAPAPAAVTAPASAAQGDSADASAFAAQFESALSSLASASSGEAAAGDPKDALLAPVAELPSAAEAQAAAPAASTPGLPIAAPTEAVSAPALPQRAAPAPDLAPATASASPSSASEMTELPASEAPSLPEAAVLGAPISVISEAAAVEAAAVEAAAVGAEAARGADGAEPGAPVFPVAVSPRSGSEAAEQDGEPAAPSPDAAAVTVPPIVLVPVTLTASALTTAQTAASDAPVAAVGSAPDTTAAPAPVPPAPAPAVAATPAPDEVVAPAAPARAQAPDLVGQLSRPIHGLRSFGDGTHVITVRVNPENLGPVAVRAHVSGESMHIELMAPTEAGRDAIKAILPDLRRDLSGAPGQATLDLSSGNQPSGRESAPRDAQLSSRTTATAAPAQATGIRTTSRTDAGLDVLA